MKTITERAGRQVYTGLMTMTYDFTTEDTESTEKR